jgi:DNA-binding transcriptional LysR family regulator
LEELAAERLFLRQGRGVQLTAQAQTILPFARRVVASSDRLRDLLGRNTRSAELRIGFPNSIDAELIEPIIGALSSAEFSEGFVVKCDTRANLLGALDAGYIDAAFLVDTGHPPAIPAVEWTERWRWVKSPSFALKHEAPVPLVTGAGSLNDLVCTGELQRAGIEYSVAFSAIDWSLRKAAAAAGVGLVAASLRAIKVSKMNVVVENYLPKLPPMTAGIYVRDGLNKDRVRRISQALTGLLRQEEENTI